MLKNTATRQVNSVLELHSNYNKAINLLFKKEHTVNFDEIKQSLTKEVDLISNNSSKPSVLQIQDKAIMQLYSKMSVPNAYFGTYHICESLSDEASEKIFNYYVVLREKVKKIVHLDVKTVNDTLYFPFHELSFKNNKFDLTLIDPFTFERTKNLQSYAFNFNHVKSKFDVLYNNLFVGACILYLNEHELLTEYANQVNNLDFEFLVRKLDNPLLYLLCNMHLLNNRGLTSSLYNKNAKQILYLSNTVSVSKEIGLNAKLEIKHKKHIYSSLAKNNMKDEWAFFGKGRPNKLNVEKLQTLDNFLCYQDECYLTNLHKTKSYVNKDIRFNSKFNYSAIVTNFIKKYITDDKLVNIIKYFKRQCVIFKKSHVNEVLYFSDINLLLEAKDKLISLNTSNKNLMYPIISFALENKQTINWDIVHKLKEYMLKLGLTSADWKFLSKLNSNMLNYLWTKVPINNSLLIESHTSANSQTNIPSYDATHNYKQNMKYIGLIKLMQLFHENGVELSMLILNRLLADGSSLIVTALKQNTLPEKLKKRIIAFISENYILFKKKKRVKHFISETISIFDYWSSLSHETLFDLFKKKTSFEQFITLHNDWAIVARWHQSDFENKLKWNGLLDPMTISTYTVVPLCTGQQLLEESKTLDHCVATYAKRCASGVSRIFSIKCNVTNRSIVTFELSKLTNETKFFVRQVRGFKNKDVENKFKLMANKICKQVNALPNLQTLLKEVHTLKEGQYLELDDHTQLENEYAF